MEEVTPSIPMRLVREPYKPDATRGVLYTPWGQYMTIERPWLDNASGVSCFPEGVYHLVERFSPHFKKQLYWFKDLKTRGFCLIHNGSYCTDSLGCLLIGKSSFTVKQDDGTLVRGIGMSRIALNEFMVKCNHQHLTIEVTRQGATA